MIATTVENKIKAYDSFKKVTKINKQDTITVQKKNFIQLKLTFGKTNNFTTITIKIKHNKLHNI